MKHVMYLSISILCLAIAVLIANSLTTREAGAQAVGQIVGYTYVYLGSGPEHYIITANGDVFGSKGLGGQVPDCNGQSLSSGMLSCPATYLGNVWTLTPPVSTSPETWGKIKATYENK